MKRTTNGMCEQTQNSENSMAQFAEAMKQLAQGLKKMETAMDSTIAKRFAAGKS